MNLREKAVMLFLLASVAMPITAQNKMKSSIQTKKKTNLEKDTLRLKEVVVTGKSSSQRLKEGAFTVSAVDIKKLAASITSVADIVNRSAGVKIRTEGGMGSDYDLSLNGMSGNSVKYFIDGVPLSTMGGNVTLQNIPVNTVERIEIYKGVVPAYLGADALGGAVNIITKKQANGNFIDASVSAGSFGSYIAEMNAKFIDKKTGFMLHPSFSYNTSKNSYKMKGVKVWSEENDKYIYANRKRFHDGYHSTIAQLEFGIENKKWADALLVSASYSKTNKQQQTGATQDRVYGKAERKQYAWNVQAKYRKRNFLVKNLTADALLSYTYDNALTVDTVFRNYDWNGNYTETTCNEIMRRSKMMRRYIRPLTVARANLNYRFNEHHSLNLNYMLTHTENKRSDDLCNKDHWEDTDFTPSNDLVAKHIIGLTYNQSLFGGRMDNAFFLKDYINHVNIHQSDLSWITNYTATDRRATKSNIGGGFGLRYTLWEPLSVKLSYERTVRLPQARELLGNGTTVYPNFKLKPETSNNINIGIFGNANWQQGAHRLSYDASLFWRDVKDYIFLVVSEAEGMYQYDNMKSIRVNGLECDTKYSYADWLSLSVNCSYQRSINMNRWNDDGKESVIYKNKLPNKPWLFGNATLQLTKHRLLSNDDMLKFNYAYQYVHWFFLTWEGFGSLSSKSRIPTQNFHSASLTYSWKKERYSLTVSCDNLFDCTAYDNFKLQKPGRSLMTKFRVFIN